jgi:uncharacterized protein with FMN-binding domain/Pyruvate/2-oxoacid:ferredoxin oxidoreductase delta subunit
VFKKKISLITISRAVIQLIFLYFFSGVFTLAFTGFKSIYLGIFRKNFSVTNSFGFLAAFVAVVVVSVLIGRFFCGWLCAFGTFNDFIYLVSRKVFKKKVKIPQAIDEKLKYVKYIVLLGIIIFIWSMDKTPENSINPWDAFAQLPQIKSMAFQIPIAFILLALITVGAMFIERFFCRYLCPLGAILAVVSKFKIMNISKPSEKCGKCQLCTVNCPMGINLSKVEAVDSGECISCLKCVDVCYRSNPKLVAFKKLNMKWYSSTAAGILVFCFIFWAKKFVKPELNISSKVSAAQMAKVDEAIFNDGVYVGIGNGFRPNMKVEVKIVQGRISDIQIISHEETKGYYEQAFDIVPKEIIAAQSPDVDTVSGATKSSNGIIEAVRQALNKARKFEVINQVLNNENSENNEKNVVEVKVEDKIVDVSMDKAIKFKDGTYKGVGTGYKPGLTVSVTVKGGKIITVQIISSNETPGFYEKAFSEVPKQIIAAQSTNVDIVSGATFSSRGIMAAVKNALSKAVISGELPQDKVVPIVSKNTDDKAVDLLNIVTDLPVYVGDGLYKDGVYIGSARGFNPNIKVSVTVKDGKITTIEILEHNETPGFYEKAFAVVPNEIISKQNTNVDTVSGATRSSEGIIEAVKGALKDAKLDGTPVGAGEQGNIPTPSENNTTQPSENKPVEQGDKDGADQTKKLYKDGVYIGSARGFNPNIKVSVTVKDGKITTIEILEHNETPGFYEKAFAIVPNEIISKQNTNVDTVSGATRSSEGIMKAVNVALKDAILDGTTVGNGEQGNTIPPVTTQPGDTTTTQPGENKPGNEDKVVKVGNLYKDGRYTGIGRGRRNNLIVDVTVQNNKITNINLISYREDLQYIKQAMTPMSEKIITAQSTEVDVISGATQTSNGIKDAVNKALEKAKYKDGTFSATGRGYNRREQINLNVIIKDGKLTNIDIISQAETPEYFEKVWPVVPNEIIKMQSTTVDVVSGATRSSNGIMSAVKAALAKDEAVGEASVYPGVDDIIAPFRDGVYTGKANGYRDNLNVSVTIKNNKIIKINLGANNETERYFNKVWPALPSEIITKQSVDVDAVSGATRSSIGIVNAVKEALRQSKMALSADPIAPYKDGTYRGVAKGYKEGLNVDVTVKDNKIISIDLKENNETPSYFNRAWIPVSTAIIDKQLTTVDTISGATRSSNGIMEAVKQALRKAHDANLNLDDAEVFIIK